jgi:uncharacterized protein DUF4397
MTSHMRRHRVFTLLLSAAALASCGKDPLPNITAPALPSAVKFYNFGVNTPNVNFYANDTKMSAVLTSTCSPPTDAACTTTGKEATAGIAYGGVSAGGFYTGITPGQYNLKAKLSATNTATDTIAKVPVTIETGKFYSFYTSGFYNSTTKSIDNFFVEDPIPTDIDPTKAYVRFVNAISNSSPMTLYAKSTVSGVEVSVGGVIAYKAAGAFVAIPADVYDLGARTSGSSTNAISRTAVSLLGGRVYTISARGDMTVTSTTATNRPFLDNTANR